MTIITHTIKIILVLITVIFLFSALLFNSSVIANTTSEALAVCYFKLIPSIFPFMVLSGFFMNISGKKHTIVKNEKSYSDKYKASCFVILLSWISGFVVGPKYLCENELEQDATSKVFLCSNAGIGFVISYVGVILWGNIFFGIFLYFIQLIWSLTIYLLIEGNSFSNNIEKFRQPIISAMTSSIQNSTRSMLDICGFTVIFSIIKNIFSKFLNSELLTLIISSTLEISSGALASVCNKNNLICAFFTGFTVGFGGVCMCMQTFAVCIGDNIKKLKFIEMKLIHGILCGLSSLFFVMISKVAPVNQVWLNNDEFGIFGIVISALFLCSLLNLIKKLLKNKLYSL